MASKYLFSGFNAASVPCKTGIIILASGHFCQ